MITLNSSTESDWIRVVNAVKAEFGDKTDIEEAKNARFPVAVTTTTGNKRPYIYELNVSTILSFIGVVLKREPSKHIILS